MQRTTAAIGAAMKREKCPELKTPYTGGMTWRDQRRENASPHHARGPAGTEVNYIDVVFVFLKQIANGEYTGNRPVAPLALSAEERNYASRSRCPITLEAMLHDSAMWGWTIRRMYPATADGGIAHSAVMTAAIGRPITPIVEANLRSATRLNSTAFVVLTL